METSVLITGANRGIGLAIARRLAEGGKRVLLGSRDLEAGQKAVAPLQDAGLDVHPLQIDLSDPENIEAAVAEIDRNGWLVDTLVNNAGVLYKEPLLDLTAEQVADSVAVHLTGPLSLIRLLVPKMLELGHGRIVNLSSGWGSFGEGMGGPGAYGITKAALNALTVRLAKELPNTIKVNAMCPGWVRTRMGGDSAERSPEEGADTAVWLATLPDDGPSGGFFRDRQPIEW